MFNIKEKFFLSKSKIKKSIFFLLSLLRKKSKNIQSQEELDIKLVRSLAQSKIPSLKQLKHIGKVLTKKERILMRVLFVVVFANLLFLGYNFYYKHLTLTPAFGGEYTEGVVDVLQYINPLYSVVDSVDKDLESLIFSGLFKFDKDGKLVNDLAVDYTVNKDKTRYDIFIRDGVKWHNGDDLTVDDIVFTFKMIQNPDYGSVIHYRFNNVVVEKTGEKQVSFILKDKQNNFLDTLTFGILPKRIWSQISPETVKLADLNLKPIGSGKYKFDELIKDKMGNIVLYRLVENTDYYGQRPYIKNISFKFFINEMELIDALNSNKIDGAGGVDFKSQDSIAGINSLNVEKIELSQIGAVFFNQDNLNLKNKDIRQALSMALDKYDIIDSSFGKNAQVIHGPLVPYHKSYQKCITSSDGCITRHKFDPWQSKSVFKNLGWENITINQDEIHKIQNKKTEIELQKQNQATTTDDSDVAELSKEEKIKLDLGAGEWIVKKATSTEGEFNINEAFILNFSIIDRPRYVEIANVIEKYWRELGVKVDIDIIPVSDIQSRIVENKDFDCLLWTYDLGHNLDLYPFWHKDEVLNFAGYSNEKADKILEELDGGGVDDAMVKYTEIQKIITSDTPAVFMYSPYYIYLQSKKVKNFNLNYISSPNERFVDIANWHIKTERKLVF